MRIYGFSGLGADKRVFEYLKFDCEFVPVDWIDTLKNENIENYAIRLSKIIDTKEDFGVLGVSFGGLIAVEITKHLNPKFTILISSIETRKDLRWIYKVIGKSKILKLIPKIFFKPPPILVSYFFGAKNKKLLKAIIKDTDPKFVKWALQQLLNWKNETKIDDSIKIVGEKDIPLPAKKLDNHIMVKNGKHFMVVDKAEEITEIIRKELDKKSN